MRYTIPAQDWSNYLAYAIESAVDGDVIEVHSNAMVELAEDARQRMCSYKHIAFEIVPLPDPFAS